jgi:precorrin-8X/cobalt-precorrin-8 methylmutase
MTIIKQVAPSEIENQSFAIIESEFEERTGFKPDDIEARQFQVIRRVIHATGDFGFATSLLFQAESIDAGISAIKGGKDIYIDVSMGASGISSSLLTRFGGTVQCHINDDDVAERARREGKTRSETALEKISDSSVGIIAVGNAPTALIGAMDLIASGKIKPDLLVGVPVGFVNAEESKEILAAQSFPFITNRGRKGGTPVAVAIVNALLRLAL